MYERCGLITRDDSNVIQVCLLEPNHTGRHQFTGEGSQEYDPRKSDPNSPAWDTAGSKNPKSTRTREGSASSEDRPGPAGNRVYSGRVPERYPDTVSMEAASGRFPKDGGDPVVLSKTAPTRNQAKDQNTEILRDIAVLLCGMFYMQAQTLSTTVPGGEEYRRPLEISRKYLSSRGEQR